MKLIINNKNEKLSPNINRRNERNIKIDDKMETMLIKTKTEQKKRGKIIDKIKELEIELVKIKNVNNPYKLQSELKELKKQVLIKTYMRLNEKYY